MEVEEEKKETKFIPTYKIIEASDEDKLKYADKFSTNESKSFLIILKST